MVQDRVRGRRRERGRKSGEESVKEERGKRAKEGGHERERETERGRENKRFRMHPAHLQIHFFDQHVERLQAERNKTMECETKRWKNVHATANKNVERQPRKL